MKYSKQIALEIVNKYDLDLYTMYKWKSRKRIPNKYSLEPTKIEPIIQEKIETILNSKKIRIELFATYSNISRGTIYYILRKSKIYKPINYFKIKKALEKIRSDAEKAISDFNENKTTSTLLNFIIQHKELCYTRIFNDRVILNWKNKSSYASIAKIQKWINKLSKFCIEIQLP